MIDKCDYYDILGILVPGVLLSFWVPICFPQLSDVVVDFPSEIDLLGFVALTIFVGHIVQAVASAVEEPVLFRLWGGRPSEVALARGLGERYLPSDAAQRIRRKLAASFGSDASNRALFLGAMRLANAAPNSRAQTFNSLYAFHRALLVVSVAAQFLLILSSWWGAAGDWTDGRVAVFAGVLLALLILMYCRTRQRAYYFVREVLLVAEGVLDSAAGNRVSGTSSPTT